MKTFTPATPMNSTEAYEHLKINLPGCPYIKDISINPKNGCIKLKGKFGKYLIAIRPTDNNIIVIPPVNISSIIIGYVCFFVMGVFYTIQYVRGKSEREAVMTWVSQTLVTR